MSGYFGKDIPLSPSGALVWICVVFFGSGSSSRQPRVEILSFPLSVAPVPETTLKPLRGEKPLMSFEQPPGLGTSQLGLNRVKV